MKKFICTLLAIMSVFGLCACGQTNEAGVAMATKEPTKEEREIIVEYYYAVKDLEDGNDTATHVVELYQKLLAMTEYDKYTGTQYASTSYLSSSSGKLFSTSYSTEISTWNRKEVLSRFTLVEDQLVFVTQVTEDRVGNQNTSENYINWQYDADGKVLSVNSEERINPINLSTHNEGFLESDDGQYEYDENDRLVKITHENYYGDIEMVRTFTYDANGNLTQQLAKDNYQERTYDYTTENGRIRSITWTANNKDRYEIVYTYSGNDLISEVKSCYDEKGVLEIQWSMTHTYDADGQRTESNYLYEDFEDTHWSLDPNFVSDRYVKYRSSARYTYEYVNGRISTVTEIPGNDFGFNGNGTTAYENEPHDVKITYTLNYGTYCIYNGPVSEY